MIVFKRILVLFLTMIILAGCSQKQTDINNAVLPSAVDTTDTPDADQASDNGGELYNRIFNILSAGEVTLTIKDVEEDDVIKEYKNVYKDHPELFWLGDGYSCRILTDSKGKTVIFECAHASMQNIADKKSKLDSVVNNILNEANKRGSLYEKVIFVHDYLIDNTQYDVESYNRISSEKDSAEIYDATTAYGCLVDNKAVCSGYSAAFQLLMQKLGITCGRVTGRKTGGEDHEWNYIVLDGEYYYIDVTWDDPVNDESGDKKSHEYLCITTDELKETHQIDADQFVPTCRATEYDYYIYHNLYLDQYDFDRFKEIYRNYNINDSVEVKFSTSQELEKAINELVDKQKIYEITTGKSSCLYSIGNNGRVLSVTMK